ncbi:MAG: TRAP transporter small permease subunit [Betaproteobacteria bacterium]
MTTAARGAAAEAPITAKLRRFRAHYGRMLEWVVGALMVILFIEVTAGVVFRAVGHSLTWYDEVASVLLAWLTFYGSALASVKRAHIACPEVVDALPWGAWRAVSILAQLIVIAFFVLLAAVGVYIMPVLASDSLVSLSWVSLNFVQSVIPISATLIVVAEVTHLLDLVVASAPPTAGSAMALADGLH